MSFSAEHYIKVAGAIRNLKVDKYGMINFDRIVSALKEMFEKDNPRFDSIKFVDACYTEDWG
jgi:hypothetical protein